MKILVSADWHLDTAFAGKPNALRLKEALRTVPEKVAEVCRDQGCQLALLPGDLFDGPYTRDSLDALQTALRHMQVPVFITPGNHDFYTPDSPWMQPGWPENVHIFRENHMEAVTLPELDCCVYGAAFTGMDCRSLLEGFRADSGCKWQLGILHGDPTQVTSPYNPVTASQIAASGLNLLALGHIHMPGQLQAGKTLCLWPGCPMGRGNDETGVKGLYTVTLSDTVTPEFTELDTHRFYDLELPGTDPEAALSSALPAAASQNNYRITFTGESAGVDLEALQAKFSRFPNLTLRDRTVKPVDIWSALGQDSLEGIFFGMLHDRLENADEDTRRRILLAAQLSRWILDGQEVTLP